MARPVDRLRTREAADRAGRLGLLGDRLIGRLVRGGLLAAEVHGWSPRPGGWTCESLRVDPEDFGVAGGTRGRGR